MQHSIVRMSFNLLWPKKSMPGRPNHPLRSRRSCTQSQASVQNPCVCRKLVCHGLYGSLFLSASKTPISFRGLLFSALSCCKPSRRASSVPCFMVISFFSISQTISFQQCLLLSGIKNLDNLNISYTISLQQCLLLSENLDNFSIS